MADLRTEVVLPDTPKGKGWGYDCWDRKTREEAIAEYRRFVEANYQDALAQLIAAIKTPDDQLMVRVHRGSKTVEVL